MIYEVRHAGQTWLVEAESKRDALRVWAAKAWRNPGWAIYVRPVGPSARDPALASAEQRHAQEHAESTDPRAGEDADEEREAMRRGAGVVGRLLRDALAAQAALEQRVAALEARDEALRQALGGEA